MIHHIFQVVWALRMWLALLVTLVGLTRIAEKNQNPSED